MQEYVDIYNKKGVVTIPNVFTEVEMELLKEEAYALEPWDMVRAGYPHKPAEYSGDKKALIFFPALANDYINKIRTDKRLVDIVKAFIGENVKQVNNQIYFREAGDKDEFAWHQDIVFREPRHRFPRVEEGYLQTIIAVDDMTPLNGGIEFIEGSHLEGEQHLTSNPALTKMLRHFRRLGLKGEKYSAKKGSVMLWNVNTVHGSEANTSNADRMTYMNGFCRAENCLDYPWYLKDGVVQELNPKLIP